MRCTAMGTRGDWTFPPVLHSRESTALYLAWPWGWTVPPHFSKAREKDRDGTLIFSSHEEA